MADRYLRLQLAMLNGVSVDEISDEEVARVRESHDAAESKAALLSPRYSSAVDYARRLHAADVRKGTAIPYLAHLLSVSALVLEAGGDEDQAIAALLHDAAEDHGGQQQLDAIRRTFGDGVARIVEACSDSLVESATEKRSWWDRKVDYLRKLAGEDDRAALVSCADKLHNARAVLADYRLVGEQLWSRFNPDAGRRGELWYYRRLAQILPGRLGGGGDGPRAIGVELDRTVSELLGAVVAGPDPSTPDRDGIEAEWAESLEEEARLLEAPQARGD